MCMYVCVLFSKASLIRHSVGLDEVLDKEVVGLQRYSKRMHFNVVTVPRKMVRL